MKSSLLLRTPFAAACLLFLLSAPPAINQASAGDVIAQAHDSFTGDPLANIRVTLYSPHTGAPVSSMLTSGDPDSPEFGAAVFTGVPAGEYLVRYEDPSGHYSSVWAGSVADPRLSHVLNVTDTDVASPSPVGLFRSTGTIFAPVHDETFQSPTQGEPLADILVTLFDNDTGAPAASALTDNDSEGPTFGVAEFPNLAPGRYIARYEDPTGTFGPVWSGGARFAHLAETVDVIAADNQGLSDVGLILATAEINASATDSFSGDPLPGIEVTLFDFRTGRPFATATTEDDPDALGLFLARFDNVPPGDYIALFEDPNGNYGTTWTGNREAANLAEPIVVAGGDFIHFDVQLEISSPDPEGPGTLAGSAAESGTGTPLPGIEVTIFDAASMTEVGQETTGAAGTFSRSLPAASYMLRFRDPAGNYEAAWYGDTGLITSSTPVTVITGDTAFAGLGLRPVSDTVPESPPPTTGSSELLVDVHDRIFVEEDGTVTTTFVPVPGASVVVLDAETGNVAATDIANESGSVNFTLPSPRTYIALANYGTRYGVEQAIRLPSGEFRQAEIIFFNDLPTGATGTAQIGRDVNASGIPWRIINLVTGVTAASGVSPAGGLFSANVPAPAVYGVVALDEPTDEYKCTWYQSSSVQLACDGNAYAVRRITVHPGDSVVSSGILEPLDSDDGEFVFTTVSGQVTGADTGNVLPDIQVTSFDAETGSLHSSALTTSGGNYSMNVQVGNSYVVRFRDPLGAHFTEFFAEGGSVANAVAIPVSSDSPINGIDIALDPTAEPLPGPAFVSGQVNNSLDPDPVAGIVVDALDPRSLDVLASDTTDANGAFAMELIAPVEVFIRLSDPAGHYVSQFAEGGADLQFAQIHVLEPDMSTSISGSLTPLAGILAGRVTDAVTNDPVGGAVVAAIDLQAGGIVGIGVVDAFGDFMTQVPGPGSYVLLASDPAGTHHPKLEPGGDFGLAGVSPIDMAAGEFRSGIDISLVPNTVPLFGEVRSEFSGTPLPDIELFVLDLFSLDVVSTFDSDVGGQYFEMVPQPGNYLFRFQDPAGNYDSEFYENSAGIEFATDRSTEFGFIQVDAQLSGTQPPIAQDDSYSVDEDQVLSVPDPGVLGNDSDPEGAPLSALLISGPDHGSLTLNPDGGFTYTPNADFFGPDDFTYEAADPEGGSASATVNITVNAVSDPPVAIDDAFSTDEDTPLSGNVLDNELDVDGDSLTVSLASAPADGSLTLNADGSFTYTPNANFNGTDGFTYEASDGSLSDVATTTITVFPVNDPPAANFESYGMEENTVLNVPAPGVLFNDSDVDGDTIIAVLVTAPTNGSLTLNGDGSFTYTPNPDFDGNDEFTYEVSDGIASVPTYTQISVHSVNDPPIAQDDAYTTDEDTVLNVTAPGVLENDADPDGDAMTATLLSGPANGTLLLDADGSFSYTPDADFHGSDGFTYEASDGLQSDTAAVTITVSPVNDVPSLTGLVCSPTDPIPVGGEAMIQALLGDADGGNAHTITVDWGDGNVETINVPLGSVDASHAYNEAGVYEVAVTAEDSGGAQASAICDDYIVVFDPNGGFVTGGGWIDSPPGAYLADPYLTGRASFGFVAKYRKGVNRPDGTTEFQFKAGDLYFESGLYDWLVVASFKGMFKGEGMVNGEPGFGFLISAIDGNYNDGTDPDRFRIKIWRVVDELLIYDNQLACEDDSEEADPCTELGGGSIVIHTKGKK